MRVTTMRATGIVFSLAVLCLSSAVSLGADRTAAQILKDIDAIKAPTLSSSKTDDSHARAQQLKIKEAAQKRARLIRELYKVDPDHKRMAALLEERWQTIGHHPEKAMYADLLQELDQVIGHTKNKKLRIEAAYSKAQLKLNPVSSKRAPDPAGAEEFVTLAPKDPRAEALLGAAVMATKEDQKKADLLKRLAADYPDSDLIGMFGGSHDPNDSIGKPFHLQFANAVDGSSVSMKGLRGKVVVVDFWATWCGPCVAEMPKMKELYAKYHDKGVEFIGISLDQPEEKGGLDALKKFVKEHDIKWPQYYQGKFWSGEFSSSWGINSIPRVFVVDADGKLYSVNARGKLEKMIPELLAKKAKITYRATRR
jgi:thiol-disulfide isomerase/thioredoxin